MCTIKWIFAVLTTYATIQTFVTLSTQAPQTIVADRARRRRTKSFRLVSMAMNEIELLPAPCASPVDQGIFARTQEAWLLRPVGEHVDVQFFVGILLVQANGRVQFSLRRHGDGIQRFIEPFDGEHRRVAQREVADGAELIVERVQREIVR